MAYGLQPGVPLEDEIRRVAHECLDGAIAGLEGLRAPGTDPATIERSVHEVRKRCKEVRGLARLIRPALGERYAPFNAAVRDAARELGSIRDAHVRLSTIEALQASLATKKAHRIEPLRREQETAAAEATRSLGPDDARLGRAAARLAAARAMTEGFGLDDTLPSIEDGLRRTYRDGRRTLRKARSEPDDVHVHEWRKSVKHLWYQARLLQPADPAALEQLVDDLDKLSELLGDDHDLAVLVAQLEARVTVVDADHAADDAVQHAVTYARRRQDELRAKAFERGRRLYSEAPRTFVDRVVAPWRAAARATHAASVESPAVTTVERERKFLVRELPTLPDTGTRIVQGYLALDSAVTVRLRDAGGNRRTLTLKGGSGRERTELEWPVQPAQWDAAWPLTAGQRVEKTRYVVPLDGHDAELDVFDGTLTGLVMVEVEFDSVGEMDAFEPPDWFGAEVTDDERYSNASLARHGLRGGEVG